MKNNPISKLGVQKNKVSGIPAQIGIGAGIENSKYQNKSKLISQTDVDADMYSKMADKFKSKDGGRPRGLWNNFGAGVMEGMAYGARSQGSRERKADYDRYDHVMNYFNEVNNAAMEQNAWYEKRAMEMESIQPYAIAGLEVSYSGMDYATGNERMRNLVDQAKLNNPNIKGDYIGYVPNSPIVNLRDENGNITALSLSTLAGEDSVKRIQGNYIDQQARNVAQQKEDRERKSAPDYSDEEDYGSIPLENIKKGGGGRAFMNTINAEMNLAKDIPVIMSQLDEAQQIIKDNPAIGTGWSNYLSKGSFTKSLMDDKTRVAVEKLDKIASRVEEAFIKAKGTSITDSERETIKKGLFQTTNTGESNKFNIDSVKKELLIAQERGEFTADELVKGRVATPQSFRKFQEAKKMGDPFSNWEKVQ